MPTVVSWRRILSEGDPTFITQHYSRFAEYSGNGGSTADWNSIKQDFVSGVRSAPSTNGTYYDPITDFKVLAQSSLTQRVGINIIFDPATPSGTDYYLMDPGGGGIARSDTPWGAAQKHGAGEIAYPAIALSQIVDGSVNVSPASYEWFTDGINCIYYEPLTRTFLAQGFVEASDLVYYNAGRNYALISPYYDSIGWRFGAYAIAGQLPWTIENLVPNF